MEKGIGGVEIERFNDIQVEGAIGGGGDWVEVSCEGRRELSSRITLQGKSLDGRAEAGGEEIERFDGIKAEGVIGGGAGWAKVGGETGSDFLSEVVEQRYRLAD